MFGDYVLDATSARYDNRILIIDDENLDEVTHYSADFATNGYEVVRYKDDLSFRIEYDGKLDKGKIVVMANSSDYIPYDMRNRLRAYIISLSSLFPKLNAEVLHEQRNLNFELLCLAYVKNFDELQQRKQTEDFLQNQVYSKGNVAVYLERQMTALMESVKKAQDYRDWFAVAQDKANVDVLAVKYGLVIDTSEINCVFKHYVLAKFGRLSSEMSRETPILVSRAMEYIYDSSRKFVIIVMDGMSVFDWKIISQSFDGIPYTQVAAFAMIPTTTSISRQCLLSNKYPSQLMEPWKQSKEKNEFIDCARKMGFTDEQIGYARGYDAQFGTFVKCGAVIINDVDDMVHSQRQGRLGMFNDITVLANQKKLADMTKRFLSDGFDIYISADHGNTPCTGLGKLMGTGLEVETKSRRMVVLQDFADKETLQQKYELIDYPQYYLKKEFDYLICDVGDSFDAKGEDVMTHGGISIDEVVVPFIKIKAVKTNG